MVTKAEAAKTKPARLSDSGGCMGAKVSAVCDESLEEEEEVS